jgi:hypothetical protein
MPMPLTTSRFANQLANTSPKVRFVHFQAI